MSILFADLLKAALSDVKPPFKIRLQQLLEGVECQSAFELPIETQLTNLIGEKSQ
jgi:hypothetical protein